MNNIQEWAAIYHVQILEILKKAKSENAFIRNRPDILSLCLSEMPLCDAMWGLEDILPPGYFVMTGSVHDAYPEKKFEIRHTYARNRENMILCITPGQFIMPYDDIKAGERIAALRRLAPELVTVYPGGLAVLAGSAYDISQKLHLSYWYDYLSTYAGCF